MTVQFPEKALPLFQPAPLTVCLYGHLRNLGLGRYGDLQRAATYPTAAR
jgi:hypothetical protein